MTGHQVISAAVTGAEQPIGISVATGISLKLYRAGQSRGLIHSDQSTNADLMLKAPSLRLPFVALLVLTSCVGLFGQPASIRESRFARPLQWVYYDHPVADSTFIGMIDPLIWGLLMLLGSLWALFLQADHAEIDKLVGRNPVSSDPQPNE